MPTAMNGSLILMNSHPEGAASFTPQPVLPTDPDVRPASTDRDFPKQIHLAPGKDAAAASGRCSTKGCVFPARFPWTSLCRYHELLESETESSLFESWQPTYLLSLKAPCEFLEEEFDDSRERDRRRQAAEREAFLLDDADAGQA